MLTRALAAALALQLAACATVAPPPAAAPAPDLSAAAPVHAGEQCPGDGVWLPTATAAAWAGDWTTCRRTAADCQARLAERPSEAPSATWLAIAAGVGALLGAGAVALVRR